MELGALDLLIMALGGWAIAYGVVSGTVNGPLANADEIQKAQQNNATRGDSGEPMVVPQPRFANEYYGQTDGKSGPLALYAAIRWLLSRPEINWINEGGYCRVCISASAAGFVGLLLSFGNPVLDLLAFSIAANGAVIIYGNLIMVVTARPPTGEMGLKINDF